MINLSRRRRNGIRILCVLSVFPCFILAHDGGKVPMMNCLNGPIHVFSVYLTCDSAGSYYYGSSSYRNSSTCKYGDKAHLCAYLEVTKDFEKDGIMLSVDAGVYGALSSAIDPTDFCQVSEISTTDDENAFVECGTSGDYQLRTYFTLAAFADDTHFHYTPDLRLRFYNATSMAVIGCAVTGTIAENFNETRHAEMGLAALGISLLVLGTCFGLMLYLTYRRKKRLEQEQKDRIIQECFYVRTTKNGRVSHPVAGGSIGSFGGSIRGSGSRSSVSSQITEDI